MTHLHNSVNHHGSPLTPLPGDIFQPPSTSTKSHMGRADLSATPSRIVGNPDKLGSPSRASSFEMKRKMRRQSDSAEPPGRRTAMRKGKTISLPEEDPNAKDLEAVENAIKDTLGESRTTSDESHDPMHKNKRKMDTQSEYLRPHLPFPDSHLDLDSSKDVPATPPPKRAKFGQGRMGFVGGGGAGPNEVFVQGDVSVRPRGLWSSRL